MNLDSKKQRAFAQALCKELGLEPGLVTNIQVDLDGIRAAITWHGVKFVTPQELSQMLYAAEVEAESREFADKATLEDPNLEWRT